MTLRIILLNPVFRLEKRKRGPLCHGCQIDTLHGLEDGNSFQSEGDDFSQVSGKGQ